MKTRVYLGENSYDILIENHSLSNCSDLFTKYGRVLVVTDTGVPKEYGKKWRHVQKISLSYLSCPKVKKTKI